LPWEILPLRAVVQNPKNAMNGLSLVLCGSTARWVTRRVRNPFAEPAELFIRECKHVMDKRRSQPDKGFGIAAARFPRILIPSVAEKISYAAVERL
jgi:hypothetical protein